MEASVAEVEEGVGTGGIEGWRGGRGGFQGDAGGGAAKDFTFGEGRYLGNEDVEAFGFEAGAEGMQRAVELDGGDHGEGFARREVAGQGGEEVGFVDGDVNEDVEGCDLFL